MENIFHFLKFALIFLLFDGVTSKRYMPFDPDTIYSVVTIEAKVGRLPCPKVTGLLVHEKYMVISLVEDICTEFEATSMVAKTEGEECTINKCVPHEEYDPSIALSPTIMICECNSSFPDYITPAEVSSSVPKGRLYYVTGDKRVRQGKLKKRAKKECGSLPPQYKIGSFRTKDFEDTNMNHGAVMMNERGQAVGMYIMLCPNNKSRKKTKMIYVNLSPYMDWIWATIEAMMKPDETTSTETTSTTTILTTTAIATTTNSPPTSTTLITTTNIISSTTNKTESRDEEEYDD